MALNPKSLTDEIKTELEDRGIKVENTKAIEAIATAILNHITQNGQVMTQVTTTGSPSAQTGTGIGTIS